MTNLLEEKLDFKSQYESQRNILQGANILKRPSSGEASIFAIDGRRYPMPLYEAIIAAMRDKSEILEKKIAQGFTKLLIVPFGMRIDNLIEVYETTILKHYAENKFFAPGADGGADEPLRLNAHKPVLMLDNYQRVDTSGVLVYNPKRFGHGHQGKTKQEILASSQGSLSSAWRILLIEAESNIPRETKGNEIGGRRRFETNKTPDEYLAIMGKDAYEDESGFTPEDWLMYAIVTLAEKNQVIDDVYGTGSMAYNTGAYFHDMVDVPCAYWDRNDRLAHLGRFGPRHRDSTIGTRSAVVI